MRNGAGTYTPPSNSWNPAVPGQPISSDDWAAILLDISAALTQSIAADGQTPTTLPIPFSLGIQANGGSVSVPSISFVGDTDTGFYRPGANQIGLACGGVSVLTASPSGVSLPFGISAPISLPDGTLAAPSLLFASNTDTGLYRSGSNTIVLVCGGVAGLTVTSSGAVGNLTGNASTASKWLTARSLSFTGDATGSASVDGSADVATALTLANTAVTPGSYTNANVTVDAKGRVTAASSGAAPTQYVKAFVRFAGVDGPLIGTPLNVTSVTRNGAGDYTVNFTTNIGSSNYTLQATALAAGAANNTLWIAFGNATTGTTAPVFARVVVGATSPSASDPGSISVTVFA